MWRRGCFGARDRTGRAAISWPSSAGYAAGAIRCSGSAASRSSVHNAAAASPASRAHSGLEVPRSGRASASAKARCAWSSAFSSALGRLGQGEKRARDLRQPLDEPDQPAEALPPALVARGATVRAPELDQHAGEAAGQAGAAQAGALERPHLVAEGALVLAVARERVLERGEQGDRRDAVGHHARAEQQKGAGRGLIERRACGIIDLDPPAAQLGGDPAGELTVARHQGGVPLGVLERGAHAQREGEGFARQIGVAFQHQALQRRRGRRRHVLPGGDRGRRTHHLAEQSRARRIGADPRRGPFCDRGTIALERLEQLFQAVLRVTRRQHPPARLVHRLIETGQHDGAPGQRRDRRKQRARRGNAAGGAGGDDPALRRRDAPARGQLGN